MRLFFVISFCLLLSACGSAKKLTNNFFGSGEDNSEKPTALSEIRQRLSVIELWSENVGSGSDEKYLKLAPRLRESAVFIADNDGDLTALDSSSGKRLWRVDTDEPITGGPGASDSLVLVGTQEGELLAYDALGGEARWKARVSSEILSAPQAEDNIVVTRTIDGKIFGIDAENGKRLWVYDRTVPALTLRGTSAPIIDSGLVISGFDGGRLAALELETGKLFWETRITQGSGRSEIDRMVDIDAEPIIDAGTIYVATFQGNVAAVELETGRVQWARDIPSHAGIGINDDYVFITDDSSHVWALDRFSGASVWKQEKLQARAATAPTSISQYVVVGDLEGYLHWMDASTGDFIARTRISEAKIIAAPTVKNDTLYAYSSDGNLGAYTFEGNLAQEISEVEDPEVNFDVDLTEATVKDVEDNYDDEEGILLEDLMDIFESDDEAVE